MNFENYKKVKEVFTNSNKPYSKIELSKIVTLNPNTITSAIKELLKEKYIEEVIELGKSRIKYKRRFEK